MALQSYRQINGGELIMDYEPDTRARSWSSSPALNCQPRMSISSIVNPSSDPPREPSYPSPQVLDSNLIRIPDSPSGWLDESTPLNYFHGLDHYDPASPSATVGPCAHQYSYQQPLERSASNVYRLTPQYEFLGAQSNCYRNHVVDCNAILPETLARPSSAYPPASYVMDPERHLHRLAYHSQPNLNHHGLLENNRDTPDQLEFMQSYSPTPVVAQTPAPSLCSTQSTELDVLPTAGSRAAEDSEDCNLGRSNDEMDIDDNEPYAKLIHRALMSVPGHRMVLKEIYEWFMANTDKNKNPSSKGWQNSIRHNLSMNGAFKKVEQDSPSGTGKKGFVWVLDPNAVIDGVKSTTRYRKSGTIKKMRKADGPVLQRQASGRKGGQASRRGKVVTRRREREAAGMTAAAAVTTTAGSITAAAIDTVTSIGGEGGAGSPRFKSEPETAQQHHTLDTPEKGAYEQLPSSALYGHPTMMALDEQPAMGALSYPNYAPRRGDTSPPPQHGPSSDPPLYAYDEVIGVSAACKSEPLFGDPADMAIDACAMPDFSSLDDESFAGDETAA